MTRAADDRRFTVWVTLEVAEVLRRNGYPIPGPDDLDCGRIYVAIQETMFRLIYDDTDLGSRQPPPAPADTTASDHRGVEA